MRRKRGVTVIAGRCLQRRLSFLSASGINETFTPLNEVQQMLPSFVTLPYL